MAALANTVYTAAPNPKPNATWKRLGSAAQAQLMRPTPITDDTLSRAFTTALILTANVEQAEAAILDAISVLDPCAASDEKLFLEAARAAIVSDRSDSRPEAGERASSMLPPGLRPVLGLPRPLRHCFVLRILAGLPAEVCAQWMHLKIPEVDQAAGRAAQVLAGIS